MPRRVIIPNPKSPDEKPARKVSVNELLMDLVSAVEGIDQRINDQNKVLERIAYAIEKISNRC